MRKPLPELKTPRAPRGFSVDTSNGKLAFEAIFPTQEHAHISLAIEHDGRTGLQINGTCTNLSPAEALHLANALYEAAKIARPVYVKPRVRCNNS